MQADLMNVPFNSVTHCHLQPFIIDMSNKKYPSFLNSHTALLWLWALLLPLIFLYHESLAPLDLWNNINLMDPSALFSILRWGQCVVMIIDFGFSKTYDPEG